MTHSQLHLGVRHALRGSPYRSFCVVAESVEVEDGGVLVEWRIGVLASEGGSGLHLRGRNPTDMLAELRQKLEAHRETEAPPPPELEAVGAPISPRGAA